THFDVPFTLAPFGSRSPALNITGGTFDSSLTINDPLAAAAGTFFDTYSIDRNRVWVLRGNPSPVFFDQIAYTGLHDLTLNTGAALFDQVNVEAINGVVATVTTHGVGQNSVFITPTQQNIANIFGKVIVNGGGPGPTSLVIDDRADLGNTDGTETYLLDAQSVSRRTGTIVATAGQSTVTAPLLAEIDYSNVA